MRETIDPLQACRANPRWGALGLAGHEIEQRTDGKPQSASSLCEVLSQPELLVGIAHRDQKHIGMGGPNGPRDAGVLGAVEIAVPVANDRVTGADLGQTVCCFFGNSRSAPQEVKSVTMTRILQIIGREIRTVEVVRELRSK